MISCIWGTTIKMNADVALKNARPRMEWLQENSINKTRQNKKMNKRSCRSRALYSETVSLGEKSKVKNFSEQTKCETIYH